MGMNRDEDQECAVRGFLWSSKVHESLGTMICYFQGEDGSPSKTESSTQAMVVSYKSTILGI